MKVELHNTKNLSEKEVSILTVLKNFKKTKDFNKSQKILFCSNLTALLSSLRSKKRTTEVQQVKNLEKNKRLNLIFDKFRKLKILQIKNKKIFGGFNAKNITDIKVENQTIRKNALFFKIMGASLKWFHKNIAFSRTYLTPTFSYEKNSQTECKAENCPVEFFDGEYFSKKKNSHYEARFFWSSSLIPEIYDLFGLFFNDKNYQYYFDSDKYILINNVDNIKIRKNEIQVKNCIQKIGRITCFNKKEIIKFPIEVKKIGNIFNKQLDFGSSDIKTSEELYTKLDTIYGIPSIDVTKRRYVRNIGHHTKIEFAFIKIQNQEWKTISIESKKLSILLALSLFISQDQAEKLNYGEFLQKYGRIT